MTNIKDFSNIYKHKKSDVAVFLGCGKGINNISKTEWKKIYEFDVWASNNWIYHPDYIPHFYHVELKQYDFEIMQRRFKQREKDYKDVVFIYHKDLVFKSFSKKFENIYKYNVVRMFPKEKQNVNAKYKMSTGNNVSHLYMSSFTSILEILYRFGYKQIVVYGCEFYTSEYFWTYWSDDLGPFHHRWNKQHEGKSSKAKYNTVHTLPFIIDFNKRWLLPEGKEMFVGNKDTLLFPELRYKNILEV
jgi:hypothetical protein